MKSTAPGATWATPVFQQGVGETDWNAYAATVDVLPVEIDYLTANTTTLTTLNNYDSTPVIFRESDNSLVEFTIPEIGVFYMGNTSANSVLSGDRNWLNDVPEYDGTRIGGEYFSPDGTTFIIANNDRLFRYTLSSPFDLTTRTLTADNTAPFDQVSHLNGDQIRGIQISPDGTKMILGSNPGQSSGSNNYVSFTLSTPFQVNTATYVSQANSVYPSTNFVSQYGFGGPKFAVSPDGTKLIEVSDSFYGAAADTDIHLQEYTMSTPWDVSTLSFVDRVELFSDSSLSAQISGLGKSKIYMTTDGKFIFGYFPYNNIDEDTYRERRIRLNSPWDLSVVNEDVDGTDTYVGGAYSTANTVRAIYEGGFLVSNSTVAIQYDAPNLFNSFAYDISSANLQSDPVAIYTVPEITFEKRFSNTEFTSEATLSAGLYTGEKISNNQIELSFNNEIYPAISNGDTVESIFNLSGSITENFFNQTTGAVNATESERGSTAFYNGTNIAARVLFSNSGGGVQQVYVTSVGFVTGTSQILSAAASESMWWDNGSKSIIRNASGSYAYAEFENATDDAWTSIEDITSFLPANAKLSDSKNVLQNENSLLLSASGDVIRSWELDVPLDFSSINYASEQSFDFNLGSNTVSTYLMRDDGRTLLISHASDGMIEEYEMSTAWDITTLTATGRTYTPSPTNYPADGYSLSYSNVTRKVYLTRGNIVNGPETISVRVSELNLNTFTVTDVSGSNNEIITFAEDVPYDSLMFYTDTVNSSLEFTTTSYDSYQFFSNRIKYEIDYNTLVDTARYAQFQLVAPSANVEVTDFTVNLKKVL